MNEQELNKHKLFYTIEKQEFNYFAQKMVNKKHRLYTRHCLPPNYKDVLWLQRYLPEVWLENWFKQKEQSKEIIKRFKENIKLQKNILTIIQKRINKFNYKCWIIKAKTWIGKTHIIMDIIEELQLPTLILVTNKKLMQEMIDKFVLMSNYEPSQYGDGKKDISHITIMTKTSFNLCMKSELENFNCVIIDECHQWFTKKFRDKLNIFFHNKDIYLYGLSATPSTNELNESDLEKYYGKIIEVKKDHEFIPEFTFYNYYNLKEYESEHYAELRGLMSEDEDRYIKQIEIIQSKLSKCSLILCDRISEIESYYNILNQNNLENIIKITWETKISDDKKQLEESLKNNKPTIIIWSIQKCSTGFDYPPIDTIFIFSAIKFENTVIQSIWRWLRKSPWKTWCKIYVWNDKVLDKQRIQKQRAIKNEYWVDNWNIKQEYINKPKKKKSSIVQII